MSAIGVGISPVFGPFKNMSSYTSKVLSYSPIAYWPLNELSGLTADNAEGTAARDGTYSGVTLNNSTGPNNEPVGLWDGINDTCSIQTASLTAAFDGAVGSVAAWVKVSAAGVWTDGSVRVIIRLFVDASNYVQFYKNTTNNMLTWIYNAGGTVKRIDKADANSTGWMHLAFTWDKTGANETIAYYNGSDIGDLGTLGVWAGSLAQSYIGSNATPASVWSGWLAHAAIWDSVLSPADILDLATV